MSILCNEHFSGIPGDTRTGMLFLTIKFSGTDSGTKSRGILGGIPPYATLIYTFEH